jgi:hypothetical protein
VKKTKKIKTKRNKTITVENKRNKQTNKQTNKQKKNKKEKN